MIGSSESLDSSCESYLDAITDCKIPGAINDTFPICRGNKVGLYEKLHRRCEPRSYVATSAILPEAVEGAAVVDMQIDIAPWARIHTAQ